MSPRDVQWWVAALGDTLIWARLTMLDSGVAEVFDCDGRRLRYDGESEARMALLDAEFRAWDGLDDEDAATLGFDIGSVAPPSGDSDDEVLPRMIVKLPRRQ